MKQYDRRFILVLCNDTQQIETCEMWKKKGYCEPDNKYYTTMRTQCRKTCNLCGKRTPTTLNACQILKGGGVSYTFLQATIV